VQYVSEAPRIGDRIGGSADKEGSLQIIDGYVVEAALSGCKVTSGNRNVNAMFREVRRNRRHIGAMPRTSA
jgi:hypothetical protein